MQEHARSSVAALTGPVAEHLVRDQVRQAQEARPRQKALEKLLVEAYHALPEDNRLATIKGMGAVTAAVLTAKVVAIERFATPAQLVGSFGIFPVEASSGLDRDGQRRAPKRYVLCPRGSDLVRRYLYNAALAAAQHNPAVQALSRRVRARHPDHPAIAVGHAMRKLLHLVQAVWTAGRPFDPEPYPWEKPNHVPAGDPPRSAKGQAAGHSPGTTPDRQVVTAACSAAPIPARDAGPPAAPAPPPGAWPRPVARDTPMSQDASPRASPWVDFAHRRAQLPLERVREHLGRWVGWRGRGRQRRGPCPVQGQGEGRTVSVHPGKQVFGCFDPSCGSKGDVIDLWAAVQQWSLREAALDRIRTFGLEPAPAAAGTEERHG